MDFNLALSTHPDFTVGFKADDFDPTATILAALRPKLDALGCPQCCSAMPLTFIKESELLGGSGTIIGNGFQVQRLTRLSEDWALAEGTNGVVINIGKLKVGDSVDVTDFSQPATAALLIGSQSTLRDIDKLEASLKRLADEPAWQKLSRSYDAIGLAEFPLVARTNDPLIS